MLIGLSDVLADFRARIEALEARSAAVVSPPEPPPSDLRDLAERIVRVIGGGEECHPDDAGVGARCGAQQEWLVGRIAEYVAAENRQLREENAELARQWEEITDERDVAAREWARLKAENERLRAAIEPFAKTAEQTQTDCHPPATVDDDIPRAADWRRLAEAAEMEDVLPMKPVLNSDEPALPDGWESVRFGSMRARHPSGWKIEEARSREGFYFAYLYHQDSPVISKQLGPFKSFKEVLDAADARIKGVPSDPELVRLREEAAKLRARVAELEGSLSMLRCERCGTTKPADQWGYIGHLGPYDPRARRCSTCFEEGYSVLPGPVGAAPSPAAAFDAAKELGLAGDEPAKPGEGEHQAAAARNKWRLVLLHGGPADGERARVSSTLKSCGETADGCYAPSGEMAGNYERWDWDEAEDP